MRRIEPLQQLPSFIYELRTVLSKPMPQNKNHLVGRSAQSADSSNYTEAKQLLMSSKAGTKRGAVQNRINLGLNQCFYLMHREKGWDETQRTPSTASPQLWASFWALPKDLWNCFEWKRPSLTSPSPCAGSQHPTAQPSYPGKSSRGDSATGILPHSWVPFLSSWHLGWGSVTWMQTSAFHLFENTCHGEGAGT